MDNQAEARLSITNLEHEYSFVSQKAAEQSGYSCPEKMLGTTVFDLKTPVVIVSDFVHKINMEVIKNEKGIAVFDISKYDAGVTAFLTFKKPFYDFHGNFMGVLTEGHTIAESKLTPFVSDLLQQAKRLDRLDKLGGIAFEIVDRYHEHGLSKAESRILFLLTHGKTFVQAADLLCRSIRTIEGHVEHIKAKLELQTKSDLIEYAIYTRINSLMPKSLLC